MRLAKYAILIPMLALLLVAGERRAYLPEARAQVPPPSPTAAESITIEGGDAKLQKVEKHIVTFVDAMVVSKLPFNLKAPPGGVDYEWSWPAEVNARQRRRILTVSEAPKGELTASVSWSIIDFKEDKLIERSASITLYVGEVAPAPVPPGPKPDPLPPVPTGFRVLFIRETADALTAAQAAAWSSGAVKDYLDAKCVKDAGHPSWRKWDKDVDTANAPAELRQLLTDSRPLWGTLPVVVVAVNRQAKVESFPANEAALLALLKKYGG